MRVGVTVRQVTARSTVQVRGLAGDIVLFTMLGVTLRWTSRPIQGGVKKFLVASRYRNRGDLPPDWPLCSYADLLVSYKISQVCFPSNPYFRLSEIVKLLYKRTFTNINDLFVFLNVTLFLF